LWAVEHHFADYSFCPDNLQLMAHLAAICPNADIGTAAVILPWNNPLRVAEKAVVADMLSGGRLRLGVGRGLARREFHAFDRTMDQSRERFDEAASMIIDALKTGWIEGNGTYYPQPRTELRPRPRHDLSDRIYAVASSDDSLASAARLAARMVMFADRPWNMRLPAIEKYRALFQEQHKRVASPVLIADFCLCTSGADAEEVSRRHLGSFVKSNIEHYELMGEHFSQVKGYNAYAQKSELARQSGVEGMIDGFMKAAIWGSPERILRALEERRTLLGGFEMATSFRFGGIPYDLAESSMRLFAREVLPVIRTWQSEAVAA
jgi:alkanesulfonate monooxygenase SsuD/methylene tetrahydromethanopterin reductase-like flavin-dependent oxidoreductase (luciferase family)